MVWQIKFDNKAKKELSGLDKPVAKRIINFLRERVSPLEDPRSIGEALKGSRLGEFWKYRIGDYRVIASIEDKELKILVVRVGNRKEIYRKN